MNVEDYTNRVIAIEWDKYETAYGRANNVPQQLIKLISTSHATAMDASHELWCGLCHQHAYISSAAEPAYLFLREVLIEANDELQIELLDIFAGFAECTSPKHPEGNGDLQIRIRALLINDVKLFNQLIKIEGKDGFAEFIVEELENA